MWDNLKSKYTEDSWYSKWQIFNRLQEGCYTSSKNMTDFGFAMKSLLQKLNDVAITIQNHITVKILNTLGAKFETNITILNKKACNEKRLPNLDIL